MPFLEEHLNVNWLRPESALWDAIASTHIAAVDFESPVVDLGSGNGIFSFITAGGSFSSSYDWYRNVDTRGYWKNEDAYDAFIRSPGADEITRQPRYRLDWALDAKHNLLRQASALSLYKHAVVANANDRLPFGDGAFATVFSNMLYWLDSPTHAFSELTRILRPWGRAILCLQDERFQSMCMSYRWQQLNSRVLGLLNRGRSQSSRWTVSYEQLVNLARGAGFEVLAHSYYLSPLTLRVWDIGLRPLFPALASMVAELSEAARETIKREWIETLLPFCSELYELDMRSTEQGGYHLVHLRKSIPAGQQLS